MRLNEISIAFGDEIKVMEDRFEEFDYWDSEQQGCLSGTSSQD
jgi:hypothetical protein